jgi:signal peptidase I
MSDKKIDGGLWETIKTIFVAVLIALVVRTFAYEPFNIPSGSMKSTLLVGDYLFVSKFAYGYSRYSFDLFGWDLVPPSLGDAGGRVLFDEPERGDVVVFKLPRDNATDYIKRIVGLPGDRIQVTDGVLIINGVAVKRERVGDFVETNAYGKSRRIAQFMETLPNGRRYETLDIDFQGSHDNTEVFVVPEGHYFAMGDNRDNSLDSRVPAERGGVGFIPAENLIGRAEIIFFSTSGAAAIWELWKWPMATRFSRIFNGVD